jgi:hypothetical protein
LAFVLAELGERNESPVALVKLKRLAGWDELVGAIPQQLLELRVVRRPNDETVERRVELAQEVRHAAGRRKLRGDGLRQRELHVDEVGLPLARPLSALCSTELFSALGADRGAVSGLHGR